MTFEDYLKLEDEVFAELNERVYEAYESTHDQPFNRYVRNSRCDPDHYERNWNRSFELVPDQMKGGVLLLHGLTDSPYSLRTIAQIFYDHGYYVLCPRMPGHGTIPAALTDVDWHDWLPVVQMAADRVRQRIGADATFYLGGYSNGGALAVKYTLDSLQEGHSGTPHRLFLFSPAIGVTRFAAFANWHKALSFIPYFEKFKWQSVEPEFDPFKYNSFPKNAGDQIYLLSKAVRSQLENYRFEEAISEFPSVITFQSVVDSTVVSEDVVDKLYNNMKPNHSELVLFDVNRSAHLEGFIRQGYRTILSNMEAKTSESYSLTVVTNVDINSLEVVAKTKVSEGGHDTVEVLNLSWPSQVYSLSHVAIPFPLDDPIYGNGMGATRSDILRIGALEPRGERDMLTIPANQLMRLRHNPFFSYMKQRIIDSIERN
jgi:alpha-beta hydrolase superfamily lysophospholipase